MSLTGSASKDKELQGNVESGGTLLGKMAILNEIRGYSAYEVAVINGFSGTELEWLATLKGKQGEQGDPGIYIGSGDMPEGYNVQIDPEGDAYNFDDFNEELKATSPTVQVEDIDGGHRITITDVEGAQTFDVLDGKGGVGAETDPTVPDWAKQPTKPEYTAEEVGAQIADCVVTFSEVNGEWTADKTFEEVRAAYNEGRTLVGMYRGQRYDFYSDGGGEGFGFIFRVTSDLSYKIIWLWEGDSVSFRNANVSVSFPVRSVNGKTGAVNLTAEDVDAISQDDLQEATNQALAQAKESGEFNGADGQDYVLTAEDKQEIAEAAAELVDDALLTAIGTGEVTA